MPRPLSGVGWKMLAETRSHSAGAPGSQRWKGHYLPSNRAETRLDRVAPRSPALYRTPVQIRRATGLMTLSTSAVAVCCCSDLAQLIEQPRVLNRDHGLSGEVFHQLDLLVGERQHLLTVDGDYTNQFIIFEHWHRNYCPESTKIRKATTNGSPWRYASRLVAANGTCLVCCRAAERAFGIGVQRLAFARIDERRRSVVKCARVECVAFAQIERAEFRSAYIGRIRQYGVEDRFKLARRRADDLEHVGGGGLLLVEIPVAH